MVALVIALVLNVIAFFYLKSWRPVVNFFRIHVAAYRGQRQIQAFRVAGMLLLLIAFGLPAFGQGAQTGGYTGQRVERFTNEKTCPGCVGYVVYSDGDDALMQNFQQKAKPDAFDQMVWNNWYWFVGGAVAIFLFLQFGGGRESNDTDINDLVDPDYRTAFVSDYHGDDAFEVPDGMHSEHMPVPVRSRSASAGR